LYERIQFYAWGGGTGKPSVPLNLPLGAKVQKSREKKKSGGKGS